MSCAHCVRLRRMPRSTRLSNRRQPPSGSEFRPLGHLRDHRGSYLATDKILRNDRTSWQVIAMEPSEAAWRKLEQSIH